MPALNLDLEYFGHRKTKRLVARLGAGAELIPLKIWIYTGRFHSEDGLLLGYSDEELVMLAEIVGNASSILLALVDVGFLLKIENGYEVHQWLQHQGHIAAFKKRGSDAANKRWKKLNTESSNATSNAPTELTNGANGALPTKNTPVAGATDFLKDEFEKARKAYPGKKRSLETEWANFKKKNPKGISAIVLLLLPAILTAKAHKEKLLKLNAFVPNWPAFEVWINGKRWEEEFETEVYQK